MRALLSNTFSSVASSSRLRPPTRPINRALSSVPTVAPLRARRRHATTSAIVPELPSTVTTLSNKVRVVTEAPGGHFQAVGVYVDAGTRYESPRTSGISHLIDRMAFKVGNLNHTSYRRMTKVAEYRPVLRCRNDDPDRLSRVSDHLRLISRNDNVSIHRLPPVPSPRRVPSLIHHPAPPTPQRRTGGPKGCSSLRNSRDMGEARTHLARDIPYGRFSAKHSRHATSLPGGATAEARCGHTTELHGRLVSTRENGHCWRGDGASGTRRPGRRALRGIETGAPTRIVEGVIESITAEQELCDRL